jgi:serpin B
MPAHERSAEPARLNLVHILTWRVAVAALAIAAAMTATTFVRDAGSDGGSSLGAVAPPENAPVDATVDGMTRFALGFYKATADPRHNTVFSPLSLAEAFGMVRAGAKGETAAQLDRTFGFPDGVDGALNALTRGIASDHPEPGKPVLNLANGMFVQDGFAIQEGFAGTLSDHYGASPSAVDFAHSPSAALETVNAWVNAHTGGRIDKILDEVEPSTRLVLTNAVYFDGKWQKRFSPAQPGTFRVAGSEVQVPMMSRDAKGVGFLAKPGAGWRAIELPYTGGRLAMRILVPTGDQSPADLLTPEILAAAAETKILEEGVLSMPRWDFGAAFDLRSDLTKLGVTDAFDPDRADLSAVATSPLFVGQATHRAGITVDENGTKASAASAGEEVAVSAPEPIAIDRPFAFEIVDTQSGAPLFLGHVVDPRQA